MQQESEFNTEKDFNNVEIVNGLECTGFALLIKRNNKFYVGAGNTGVYKIPTKENTLSFFASTLQSLIDEPGEGIRTVLQDLSLYAMHSPKDYSDLKKMFVNPDPQNLTEFEFLPYFELQGVEMNEEVYKFKAFNIGEDLIAQADLLKQENKQVVEN